jgi:hypothetical protein
VVSIIGKTFLVGLDNNQNMTSDYGLETSAIIVLPNGVKDIDKVVGDICEFDVAIKVSTTYFSK